MDADVIAVALLDTIALVVLAFRLARLCSISIVFETIVTAEVRMVRSTARFLQAGFDPISSQ
jgi:hypothetical protein